MGCFVRQRPEFVARRLPFPPGAEPQWQTPPQPWQAQGAEMQRTLRTLAALGKELHFQWGAHRSHTGKDELWVQGLGWGAGRPLMGDR